MSDPLAPPHELVATAQATPREAETLDVEAPVRASEAPPQPFRWKTNLVLFLATVFAVFLTGAAQRPEAGPNIVDWVRTLPSGASFAVPLLAILLTHEFGHYFAALRHRVDASLPYFIPMPLLSPFGTMGAVIAMRGRIKSRDALLDIGAAGPLAGLVVAIPVLVVGLLQSKVMPVTSPGIQEGQSLLYLAIKRMVLGPIPDGYDVFLSPMAFAGWSGLFVTALNLLPVLQLDGGHIAYALFDRRQNRWGRFLHLSLLVVFAYNLARFAAPVLWRGAWGELGQALSNSAFWLVWFGMVHLMKRVSGKEHPPTEPGELSPVRKGIAVFSLALFVLLFMPTPWAQY